jgi:bacteriorhodopsin
MATDRTSGWRRALHLLVLLLVLLPGIVPLARLFDGLTVAFDAGTLVRLAGPLAVIAVLALLAAAGRRLLAALVGLDVLHVAALAGGALVAGGLAGLAPDRTRLALWGVAVVLLLALLVVVLRVLSPRAGRRHRRNPDVAVLFSILRNVLVVALLLTPVVWLVAPTGLTVVDSLVAEAAYLVVDLLGTVGFGVLLLRDPGPLAAAN